MIILKSSESFKASRSIRDSYNLMPPLGYLSGLLYSASLSVFRGSFPPKETNSSLLQINDDKDLTDTPLPPPPPPCSIFMKTGCPGGEEKKQKCDEHVPPSNTSAHGCGPENSGTAGWGWGRQGS